MLRRESRRRRRKITNGKATTEDCWRLSPLPSAKKNKKNKIKTTKREVQEKEEKNAITTDDNNNTGREMAEDYDDYSSCQVEDFDSNDLSGSTRHKVVATQTKGKRSLTTSAR